MLLCLRGYLFSKSPSHNLSHFMVEGIIRKELAKPMIQEGTQPHANLLPPRMSTPLSSTSFPSPITNAANPFFLGQPHAHHYALAIATLIPVGFSNRRQTATAAANMAPSKPFDTSTATLKLRRGISHIPTIIYTQWRIDTLREIITLLMSRLSTMRTPNALL